MNFRFTVNLTEEDYLEFNKFCLFCLPHGKKQIRTYRILLAVIFVVGILISLLGAPLSSGSVIGACTLFTLLLLSQFLLKDFFGWSIKANMRAHKKKGKLPYSPYAVMEFCEETFTETTHNAKTEQRYSAIERVCVTEEAIYLFLNVVSAFILPATCFESEQERNEFLEFIKTKSNKTERF